MIRSSVRRLLPHPDPPAGVLPANDAHGAKNLHDMSQTAPEMSPPRGDAARWRIAVPPGHAPAGPHARQARRCPRPRPELHRTFPPVPLPADVLQFQAVFRTVNHPAQQRRQAGVVPFQIGQQLPGRILARSRHDLRCHLQAGTPVLHGSFRSLPGKHTVHLIQDVRIHRGQPADMLQQQ